MEISEKDFQIIQNGTLEERREVILKYNKMYALQPGQDSTPHRRWQRRLIAAIRRVLRLPKRPQDYTALRYPDGTGSSNMINPGRFWHDGKLYARMASIGRPNFGDEQPPPEPITREITPTNNEEHEHRK